MQGKILVIDDNPLDLKLVSLALESIGFACHPFDDHKAAFNWLEENTIQAIFLDLQMPTISGYELITRFRKMPATSKIPIVIVSGQNSLEDVKKAVELGATDYLIKPLDPMILQEKMTRVANKNGSNAFAAVVAVEERYQHGFFAKPIKILRLSEFGVVIESEHRVSVGETIEMRGLDRDFFSTDSIIARCLSVEPSSTPATLVMQFTFVGMAETQRQFIRKLCRRLWVESKQNYSKEAL